MNLLLIRHTNVDIDKGICYGQSDIKPASTYEYEKDIIANKISHQKIDAVYTSPLSRCTILANDLFPNNNINIDNRLMELNFGDWELKSWDSIFETSESKKWFADFVNTPCANGESFHELITRASNFLTDLKTSNNKNVAVVTHAGIIRALYCIINNIEPEKAFRTKVEYGDIIKITL